MSDWPSTLLPPLPTITPWSMEALGAQSLLFSVVNPPASATYVQNQAMFVPFRLDVAAIAVKMFYIVGGTANGNIDVGIYDREFNALVTLGATAQGTINTLQECNIADTALPPGDYWMAFSGSSATGTVFAQSAADEIAIPVAASVYMQAAAHPLPTGVATPVKNTAASPQLILVGVSFDTLI